MLLTGVFTSLLMLSAPACAEANSWLVGNWLHTFDPDGDPPDRLTFSADGKFLTTEVSSGRQIEGLYVLTPGVIEVDLIRQGKVFMQLHLTYDVKQNKLYYKSDSTGNTSYYTKIKN
jgi:hypothetical protein